MTSITEPFYWFSLNVQREMIFNPDREIEGENSFEVSRETILQLYNQ